MRNVKWGVLGTAGIAKSCTIPGMQQAENCELYAIAGRDIKKAEEFKNMFGFQKAYASYEELLADPELEVVYIPLPNTLHYEWCCKAMEAGKHVLCEKPLAASAEECEKLIATAEKNNVLFMEAFAYLHSPFMKALKEDLEKGTIGDILYMENAFITSDYDIGNIRMRRETNGGAFYDLGCYTVSQILWLLDEEPKKVQAIAEFSEENVDIYTTGILSFENKKYASFDCGMLLKTDADRRIDRLQIHGTEGVIRSDVQFNEAGELTYVITKDGKETVRTVTAPDNYKLEVEQMSRCVAGEETPYVSNAFSLRHAKTMDAVLKSIGY